MYNCAYEIRRVINRFFVWLAKLTSQLSALINYFTESSVGSLACTMTGWPMKSYFLFYMLNDPNLISNIFSTSNPTELPDL